MGGFSLLGALAGGYAQAAEREHQRQFQADQQQRQNALGLTKILLENPAVPPEYKGQLVQYGMNVMNTPYGKKIPDFSKDVLNQLPAVQTPAKTQNAPIPSVNLSMPAAPPNPGGMGTGAAPDKAPSLTQGATQANGGAFPQMAPPPIPAGSAMPGPTLPGGQQPVTLAPQQIAPAGQFHMFTAAELAQQQAQAQVAQTQALIQGLKDQGFSDEQIAMKLGMSKLVPVPAFGGLYDVGQGEVVAQGQGMSKVVGTVNVPDGKGGFVQMGRTAGGQIVPLQTAEGQAPVPLSTLGTTSSSSSQYNADTGTTTTTKTTKKILPGQTGSHAAPAKSGSGAASGGRIEAMANDWATNGIAPSAKDKPAVQKYMSAHQMAPAFSPGIARTDKSYKDISAQLDKVQTPVDQMAMRLGRLEDTLNQNTPQADALVAPELLSVMAGGQGSGIRMNEAEIARIVGGRSKWEQLKAAVNKWKLDPEAARSITPDQQKQIHDLVATVRDKIDQKRKLFEQARTDLQNAKSPEEHRAILTRVRNDVLAVDTNTGTEGAGGAGGAGGGQVTVTDPNGGVHVFRDQASADAFKKAAGIKQ